MMKHKGILIHQEQFKQELWSFSYVTQDIQAS